jgi:hypothetical protein
MDGGGGRLPVDGNCGQTPADGAAVCLRRTALEDGPGGRQTATPSGSQRAVGPLRPSVAATDGLVVRQADGRGIVRRGRGRSDA